MGFFSSIAKIVSAPFKAVGALVSGKSVSRALGIKASDQVADADSGAVSQQTDLMDDIKGSEDDSNVSPEKKKKRGKSKLKVDIATGVNEDKASSKSGLNI